MCGCGGGGGIRKRTQYSSGYLGERDGPLQDVEERLDLPLDLVLVGINGNEVEVLVGDDDDPPCGLAAEEALIEDVAVVGEQRLLLT